MEGRRKNGELWFMNFSLVCGNCRISEPSPISLWWDSLLSLIQRNSLPSSSGWLQDQLQKCSCCDKCDWKVAELPFQNLGIWHTLLQRREGAQS